jgi:arylformamidase
LFQLLSYPLSADMPLADPILAAPSYEPIQSIARGDLANLFRLTMFNHCGTHIDAPNHYDLTGKKLVDFPIEHFVFEKLLLLDIPKQDQGLITEEDLRGVLGSRTECDLLLLRTGFERYRRTDPARYIRGCPGVSAGAARYLKKTLPALCAIGLDFMSLEWTANKSHGFEAHQVLLKDQSHPMLIIEDMSLSFDPQKVRRIFAIPIFFREIDSFPATVFAEMD